MTLWILSSAEWCLRMARRISRTRFSAGTCVVGRRRWQATRLPVDSPPLLLPSMSRLGLWQCGLAQRHHKALKLPGEGKGCAIISFVNR